jgi:hypothetical protein
LLGAFVAAAFAAGAFAAGEGDAAAAGLAAGLALVAGVLALLGADGVDDVVDGADGDGDDVVLLGEFELVSGSVAHAAANAIVAVASSASAIRPIRFVLGLVISIFLVLQRLKSRTIIARRLISHNGCSHRSSAGISAWAAAKPSLAKAGLPN